MVFSYVLNVERPARKQAVETGSGMLAAPSGECRVNSGNLAELRFGLGLAAGESGGVVLALGRLQRLFTRTKGN
jgi:hypothetical protein